MVLIIVYLGFYTAGLLLALFFTLASLAAVQGLTVSALALIAALTLWLLARSGLIDAWLAIAMTGTIAAPAVALGFGLLMGGVLRMTVQTRDWRYYLALCATVAPLGSAITLALAT